MSGGYALPWVTSNNGQLQEAGLSYTNNRNIMVIEKILTPFLIPRAHSRVRVPELVVTKWLGSRHPWTHLVRGESAYRIKEESVRTPLIPRAHTLSPVPTVEYASPELASESAYSD
ncbi:hypothetical protein POJ06DRAFT_237181 [Lipomyces tetrasporus]|uniref:Uncharacterized protein n=1 Tax=Lipomyces tetrasporus TaxID=54092 RepID=A0AAD7VTI9_9ASCO|nr:uncharacterized protein POJ06DRAFT_237181 [Lipomyces tetrasporus]KAJ8101021.1 hypothetical protein POJ06DRAFT_237181 [Lipomyces tetrasporus]